MKQRTPTNRLVARLASWLLVAIVLAPLQALAQPVPRRAEVLLPEASVDTSAAISEKIAMALDALSQASPSATDYDDARRLLDEAIALDETRASTYFRVAMIVGEQLGDLDGMFGYLERFLELAQPDALGWVEAHDLLGMRDLVAYGEAARPAFATALLDSAEAHFLAAYDHGLESGASYDLLRFDFALGQIAFERRDWEGALRRFRAVLAQSSSLQLDAARMAAFALIELERCSEAIELLETQGRIAAAEQASFAAPLELGLALARAYSSAGDYDVAMQYLARFEERLLAEQALSSTSLLGSIDRDLARVYDLMAQVAIDRGDFEQSELYHRKAHGLIPSEASYQNNLAWSIVIGAGLGDPRLEEALRLAESAVELSPIPAYLDTLAEVELRLERYDDALAHLDEAIEQEPDSDYLVQQRTRVEAARDGRSVSGLLSVEPWSPPRHTQF